MFRTQLTVAFFFSLWAMSALGQSESVVSPSLAWDVAADPRNAAIGGLDVAPVEGDGWSLLVNPAAADSTIERHLYTSYLDYFAGIKGASMAMPLQTQKNRTSYMGIRFSSFGEFQGVNTVGESTGNFSGGDYACQYGSTWQIDSLWVVGASTWIGLRNLAQINAGVLGADVAVVRKTKDGRGAVGLLISNLGFQEDFSGIMPQGFLPSNIQIGWTQGFLNAPFIVHARLQKLGTWELAPEGTYDDTYDPLSGEIVPNTTWQWGDQLARHFTAGVTLLLGEHLRGHVGYNHQRQKTMAIAGRTGVNGLSVGLRGKFRNLDFSVARSVYHYAGASTHLGLVLRWPESRAKS